jgi:hypothetical protein
MALNTPERALFCPHLLLVVLNTQTQNDRTDLTFGAHLLSPPDSSKLALRWGLRQIDAVQGLALASASAFMLVLPCVANPTPVMFKL